MKKSIAIAALLASSFCFAGTELEVNSYELGITSRLCGFSLDTSLAKDTVDSGKNVVTWTEITVNNHNGLQRAVERTSLDIESFDEAGSITSTKIEKDFSKVLDNDDYTTLITDLKFNLNSDKLGNIITLKVCDDIANVHKRNTFKLGSEAVAKFKKAFRSGNALVENGVRGSVTTKVVSSIDGNVEVLGSVTKALNGLQENNKAKTSSIVNAVLNENDDQRVQIVTEYKLIEGDKMGTARSDKALNGRLNLETSTLKSDVNN